MINYLTNQGRRDSHDLDKQRVIELAQEINAQFSKDFALFFKDCINLREKERHLDNLDPETLLYKSLAKANGELDENAEDNPLSMFTTPSIIRGIGGITGSVPIYDLFPAPLPCAPIRQGYLIKLGEKVKSWKTRYFVAFNRADNYIIKVSTFYSYRW